MYHNLQFMMTADITTIVDMNCKTEIFKTRMNSIIIKGTM